ncbi:GSCOCG00000906001-RA-CDS [Cotesia congregata]|nr:GSCOCG00000906001-RA-CDS [Cotesia congregata]
MVSEGWQGDYYGAILTTMNIINQLMILSVTGYLFYLTGLIVSTLNIHIGLCTVGYVLLMSEALMVMTEENVWSRRFSRRGIHNIHWNLQLLGGAFSTAGVIVMFKSTENHFKSTHAILGITSIILMCILSFLGITVVYAVKLRSFIPPVISKFIHNFLGIASFLTGMLAQCYSYNKNWFIKNAGNEIRTLCIVFTAVIAFINIIRPLKSLYAQIKSILC